ncbi:hypothetical protein [Pseudoalteromonas phenolica]|uniref:hypothetical protein n=1 Tax=Pseudoalteromonas phenolica TaxID=161398 RepID=UPI000FFF141C|nr:hypothetical protein [Pseudoalteromonas phenolica]RXE92832.1 hypothetical protein D9981_21190 [Pseudoalteromonas phenolica O-BC30]
MATLRPVGSKSNQALLNAEYKIAPIIPDSRCLQTFEMQSSKKSLGNSFVPQDGPTGNSLYMVTTGINFKHFH